MKDYGEYMGKKICIDNHLKTMQNSKTMQSHGPHLRKELCNTTQNNTRSRPFTHARVCKIPATDYVENYAKSGLMPTVKYARARPLTHTKIIITTSVNIYATLYLRKNYTKIMPVTCATPRKTKVTTIAKLCKVLYDSTMQAIAVAADTKSKTNNLQRKRIAQLLLLKYVKFIKF